MVRTKQTLRSNAGYPVAHFEPKEDAIMPNSLKCAKCDRRFSNPSNLKRHEKQTHGEALFKFPCPVSPARKYVRKADLRDHFKIKHPEADIDEVDDVEPVEVPRETGASSSSSTPNIDHDPGRSVKKRKIVTPKEGEGVVVNDATGDGHDGARLTPAQLGIHKSRKYQETETNQRNCHNRKGLLL